METQQAKSLLLYYCSADQYKRWMPNEKGGALVECGIALNAFIFFQWPAGSDFAGCKKNFSREDV